MKHFVATLFKNLMWFMITKSILFLTNIFFQKFFWEKNIFQLILQENRFFFFSHRKLQTVEKTRPISSSPNWEGLFLTKTKHGTCALNNYTRAISVVCVKDMTHKKWWIFLKNCTSFLFCNNSIKKSFISNAFFVLRFSICETFLIVLQVRANKIPTKPIIQYQKNQQYLLLWNTQSS